MDLKDIVILYIDSDYDRKIEFKNTFSKYVNKILLANNGKDGIDKVIENNISLIITYEKLPILDAYEMLFNIRKYDEFINAIIIIDSNCNKKILNSISKIDVLNDYIAYPFSEDEMLNLIKINIEKIESQMKKKNLLNLLNQYQNALDTSAIVSKTDTKGIITYVNYKFCEISGYNKEELIGQPHNIIRHPDMPKEVFKELWDTIQAKMVFHSKIKNKRKDGSTYYTDATIMPILDNYGNIIEYIAIRFDVTDLEEATRKAKEAMKTQKIFLANMSHEIRTPLNGILGFIKLLKDEDLNDKQKKYIDIIDTSANTLLHTINEILDMSKIQSGKMQLEEIEFDISKVAFNIQSLFLAKAEEKNIKLIANIDKELPPAIISDETKIKQVLTNLINNAIKFTPEGGRVELNVRLLSKDDDKAEIFFSVKDTGIGISKEAQAKIFEPFLQAENSTTRKYGGTGLGLAISKDIVSILGGKLELKSELNKGSEFYFTINCKYLNKKIEEDIDKNKILKFNKNVLVAEDNEINQELIKELLKQRDIKVEIASDGKEAIEMANDSFDLIFLDINMPNVDGMEACQEIKKFYNKPIIALTANAIKGDREKFLESGFDDYLSKPIEIELLDKILKKYLSIEVKQKEVIEDNNIDILDKTKAIKRLGIPEAFYDKLLAKFINNFEKDFSLLKKYFEEKDYYKLSEIAHKIKGASGNLSIDYIFEITKNIEQNAKMNKASESDINKLEEAYERLKSIK